MQGLESASVKFLLEGLFDIAAGAAAELVWNEFGVGACEMGHGKAGVAELGAQEFRQYGSSVPVLG